MHLGTMGAEHFTGLLGGRCCSSRCEGHGHEATQGTTVTPPVETNPHTQEQGQRGAGWAAQGRPRSTLLATRRVPQRSSSTRLQGQRESDPNALDPLEGRAPNASLTVSADIPAALRTALTEEQLRGDFQIALERRAAFLSLPPESRGLSSPPPPNTHRDVAA